MRPGILIGAAIGLGIGLIWWSTARAQTTPTPQLKPTKERQTFQEPEGPPAPAPRPQQQARNPKILPQRPQGVYCHYVPNGAAVTIQCSNGFWQTVLPDGTVITGNGSFDPNEGVIGSGVVINRGTGGPAIGAGQTVTAPTQVVPTPAPGQAQRYGLPPIEE